MAVDSGSSKGRGSGAKPERREPYLEVWRDVVIVNGAIFSVYHFGRHPFGEMLATSTCQCGSVLEVECSMCGAVGLERVPQHLPQIHSNVIAEKIAASI